MLRESSTAPYRSIFLSDDWAHQKYFGWNVWRDAPGLRILASRRWVFRRYLILLSADGVSRLEEGLQGLTGLRFSTVVVIHDFDRLIPPGDPLVIAGYSFTAAGQGQRLLNIATFVIDLTNTLDELWRNLGGKSRNSVRKAEQAELTFGPASNPSEALDVFYDQSANAISRHHLNYADKALLMKMFRGGSLDILVTQTSAQDIKNVTIIYKSGDAALYMYGSSDKDVPSGLGQYVQWRVIQLLKERGFRWYDLGGVASKSPGDPIYKFKQSIGGQAVDLGTEFCCRGAGLRLAQGLVRFLGRLRSTQKAGANHFSPVAQSGTDQ